MTVLLVQDIRRRRAARSTPTGQAAP